MTSPLQAADSSGGRAAARKSTEQNDQCDNQREQRDGFDEREAQHRHREHRALSGRVAADGLDERSKDVTDTDTGTDNADNGEAGTEELCSFKFYGSDPF